MGFWSGVGTVAIGVAAGVGGVAALPVFGPIGVVTALGFAVGGGVGAAGGAVAAAFGGSSGNKSETKAETKAEETAKTEHDRERAERIKAYLAEGKNRERFMIALYAVSIWASAYDGYVPEDARRDIREAVEGLGAKMSSKVVTAAIEKLFATPPSVTSAMAYAVAFPDAWEEFDDAVEAGLATGPRAAKALAAFRSAWGLAAVEAGLRSCFARPFSAGRFVAPC